MITKTSIVDHQMISFLETCTMTIDENKKQIQQNTALPTITQNMFGEKTNIFMLITINRYSDNQTEL